MEMWILILLSLGGGLCFILVLGICYLCKRSKGNDGDACCRRLRLILFPSTSSYEERAGLTEGRKHARHGYGTRTEEDRLIKSSESSSPPLHNTTSRRPGSSSKSAHPSGVARTSGCSSKTKYAPAVPVNIVYPITSDTRSRRLYSTSMPENIATASGACSQSSDFSLLGKTCTPAFSSYSVLPTHPSPLPLILRSGCSILSARPFASIPIPVTPTPPIQSSHPSSPLNGNDFCSKLSRTVSLRSSISCPEASSHYEHAVGDAVKTDSKLEPRTPSPEQGGCCERRSIVSWYRSCPSLGKTLSSFFKPARECFSQPITSSSSSEGISAADDACASSPQCVQERSFSKHCQNGGSKCKVERSSDEGEGCVQ